MPSNRFRVSSSFRLPPTIISLIIPFASFTAEYDRIEGSSEHTDGGVAPAQSVVGILDAGNSGISSASGIGSSSAGSQGIIGSSSGGGSISSGSIGGSIGGGIGGGIISTGGSSSLGGGHSVAQSATYLPPSH